MSSPGNRPLLDRVLAFLEQVEQANSVDGVGRAMAAGIRDLIPAHIASVDEAAPAAGWAWCVASPASAFVAEQEPFEQHMHEHPVLVHYQRGGDQAACRISDFLAQRAFRSSGLYGGVFRHVGTEDVLAVALPTSNPGASAVVALQRSGRFTVDERALLDRLRPALAAALRHAHLREAVAAVEAGWRSNGSHVVALADLLAGRSSPAAGLLGDVWPEWHGGRAPTVLTEAVERWRSSSGMQPVRVRVDRPQARVEVEVRGHVGHVCWLVVRSWTPAGSVLVDAGLTAREIEIAEGVAAGATNAEIAGSLTISPHTVKKHLEHIYDKLGIRTRAGVAAIAAGRPSSGARLR